MDIKNKQLDHQIESLAKIFLEKKTFKISSQEIELKLDDLIKYKIIAEEQGLVSFTEGKHMSAAGVIFFKNHFDFKIGPDPNGLSKFIDQVEGYFDGSGVVIGLSNFLDHFYDLLVADYRDMGGELIALVKTLDQDNAAFYTLCRIVENKLPELDLSSDELIEFFEWLTSVMKGGDDSVLNIDLVEAGLGIRRLCRQNPLVGNELMYKCIEAQPQRLTEFHCNILSGLLEQSPKFLKKVEKLLQSTLTMHEALCALVTVTYENKTPLKKYLAIAERPTVKTDRYLQTLPRLYCNIIRSELTSAKPLKAVCFKKLQELLSSGNINVLVQIMREIRFMKGFDSQAYMLMNTLIAQESFQPQYSKAVLEICYQHSDCSFFFDLFRALINKFKSSLPFDAIREPCRLMYQRIQEDFEKYLIALLTDDYGMYRMWAIRVLTTLNTRKNNGFIFPIDKLDDLTKVKLIISITSDMSEPKKLVPFLAPIIRSDNELVVSLATHRLEILAENYGQSVIEALKENLDMAVPSEQKIIADLQTYLNALENISDQKWKIKELDPRYSSYKYLSQFNKSKEKYMREVMDATPKTGFLSMVSTVQLMKGGGFKIGDKNRVSPLSTITTSMSLPREYVTSPEQFDWERKIMYNENWKGKFDQWAAILS